MTHLLLKLKILPPLLPSLNLYISAKNQCTVHRHVDKSKCEACPTSFFVDLLRHFLTTENLPLVKRGTHRDRRG